jgi:hypothetical protein
MEVSKSHPLGLMADTGGNLHKSTLTSRLPSIIPTTKLSISKHQLFTHNSAASENPLTGIATENRLLTQKSLQGQVHGKSSTSNLLPKWGSLLSCDNTLAAASDVTKATNLASSLIESSKNVSSPNSRRRELITNSSLLGQKNLLTSTDNRLLGLSKMNASSNDTKLISSTPCKNTITTSNSEVKLSVEQNDFCRNNYQSPNHNNLKQFKTTSTSKTFDQTILSKDLSQNLPLSVEGKTQLDESQSFNLSYDNTKMHPPQTNVDDEDISSFADLKIDGRGNIPQTAEEVNHVDERDKNTSHNLDIEELMTVDTDEDKLLLTQNVWKSKTKSEKESEIQHKILLDKKVRLIREVSVSLLGNPNLMDPMNKTRSELLMCLLDVAKTDPEFILKVALYCRHDLNLRSPTNLLLAFASLYKPCRPYLPRYFSACVNIPSDWIAVADYVQTFSSEIINGNVYLSKEIDYWTDKAVNHSVTQKVGREKLENELSRHPTRLNSSISLPAILRKVMAAKFSDFDEYQLAKYNKQKKRKDGRVDKVSCNMFYFADICLLYSNQNI